ncbi:uncharacterized protein [Amphiura filiformis]|uniref:uncharacterized protein n=1 Tax=Amphiura filiformis TaxID=82378 RepID=UPI003B20C439
MALELSQKSCVDLTGDFYNDSNVGQEQQHNIAGYESKRTRESNSQKCTINGNLSHQIDNTEEEKTTMPDYTQSQEFHPSSLEDNTNSQLSDSDGNTCPSSQTSTKSSTTSPIVESTEPLSASSSSSSSKDANMNTNISSSEKDSSQSDVRNINKSDALNNSDCDSRAGDSKVEETEGCKVERVQKEDGLEDIIIPVPVLPRTPSPVNVTNAKSNNGHGVLIRNGNQQQMRKRPLLVRRPTPVKIETPTKLLNKLKMESSSFTEEEEEECE